MRTVTSWNCWSASRLPVLSSGPYAGCVAMPAAIPTARAAKQPRMLASILIVPVLTPQIEHGKGHDETEGDGDAVHVQAGAYHRRVHPVHRQDADVLVEVL